MLAEVSRPQTTSASLTTTLIFYLALGRSRLVRKALIRTGTM